MKLLNVALLGGVMAVAGAQAADACSSCGCSAPKLKKGPKAKVEAAAATVKADHGYKEIDLKQAEASIAAGAVVLDARGGKFLDDRRIPGAKVLSAGSSPKEIAAALPDKDAKILAYCTNTKCPASKALAEKLAKLGYTNVEKYPGGIDAWEKAGKKVEKVAKDK
jgi:rhodanese-related sulfurtransferase